VNFTADEIRQLRYRMGWSQAEMARCLQLDLSIVSGWEAGRLLPQVEHRTALLRVLSQAETNAEKVQRRPIAEVIMKGRGLSQIHDLEVIESDYKSNSGN
jgi:DNA-binding transcriptional regulator YiaG